MNHQNIASILYNHGHCCWQKECISGHATVFAETLALLPHFLPAGIELEFLPWLQVSHPSAFLPCPCPSHRPFDCLLLPEGPVLFRTALLCSGSSAQPDCSWTSLTTWDSISSGNCSWLLPLCSQCSKTVGFCRSIRVRTVLTCPCCRPKFKFLSPHCLARGTTSLTLLSLFPCL